MITLKAAPIEEKSANSSGELEVCEHVQGDTKLEDSSSVELKVRNREMGVKYVRDEEVGLTPVVRWRRETSASSEESESSGNLNVKNKRTSLLRYRKVDVIPEIYIQKKMKA